MIYNALDSEVKLRAMEPEDLDWLYRIENNPDLWTVGATNVPYSRYALHDYIANSSNDIYSDRQVRFIIENYKGNVVGIVDLGGDACAQLRLQPQGHARNDQS